MERRSPTKSTTIGAALTSEIASHLPTSNPARRTNAPMYPHRDTLMIWWWRVLNVARSRMDSAGSLFSNPATGSWRSGWVYCGNRCRLWGGCLVCRRLTTSSPPSVAPEKTLACVHGTWRTGSRNASGWRLVGTKHGHALPPRYVSVTASKRSSSIWSTRPRKALHSRCIRNRKPPIRILDVSETESRQYQTARRTGYNGKLVA